MYQLYRNILFLRFIIGSFRTDVHCLRDGSFLCEISEGKVFLTSAIGSGTSSLAIAVFVKVPSCKKETQASLVSFPRLSLFLITRVKKKTTFRTVVLLGEGIFTMGCSKNYIMYWGVFTLIIVPFSHSKVCTNFQKKSHPFYSICIVHKFHGENTTYFLHKRMAF